MLQRAVLLTSSVRGVQNQSLSEHPPTRTPLHRYRTAILSTCQILSRNPGPDHLPPPPSDRVTY
jgi:hypothetical protein